ncbi:SubName: Full=Uncharacterized protein {ECO:0000313/EMBL:CCA71990.1} [Serendipita indica DSM 11827]|nr:SubName: Full=Uncharacterized protein {ECO:0000313/EMBL:CCA71990.1} [Serendipita indica DSM 11827]
MADPSSPANTDGPLPKPVSALIHEEQQHPRRDVAEISSIVTRPPAYDPIRMHVSPSPSSRNASTRSSAPLLNKTSPVPEGVEEETGLAEWARTHRSQIPARLEAKLAAAGYVPTDNPDSISEEEWLREYGVTKFELARVRTLYQKSTAA